VIGKDVEVFVTYSTVLSGGAEEKRESNVTFLLPEPPA
jgi:hypothetical protein